MELILVRVFRLLFLLAMIVPIDSMGIALYYLLSLVLFSCSSCRLRASSLLSRPHPAASALCSVPFQTSLLDTNTPAQIPRRGQASVEMTKTWGPHKHIIIELYKQQNKTLHEVRKIMEETYGFDAS